MILKDIASVVFVDTLMKKTAMTAHVVQIFIKEVRVAYLLRCHYEKYKKKKGYKIKDGEVGEEVNA